MLILLLTLIPLLNYKHFTLSRNILENVAEVEYNELNAQKLGDHENIMTGKLKECRIVIKCLDSKQELDWLMGLKLKHENVVMFL